MLRAAAVQEGGQHLEQLALLIGQPWSSKSTVTCAEIGVEVSSVEM